jgi:hypothetical protein
VGMAYRIDQLEPIRRDSADQHISRLRDGHLLFWKGKLD